MVRGRISVEIMASFAFFLLHEYRARGTLGTLRAYFTLMDTFGVVRCYTRTRLTFSMRVYT